jgi:hypothetical protein
MESALSAALSAGCAEASDLQTQEAYLTSGSKKTQLADGYLA